MIFLTKITPTRMEVSGDFVELARIENALTVRDQKVLFKLKRAEKMRWLIGRLGEKGFQAYLDGIKAEVYRPLLFKDTAYWTYPGLRKEIEDLLGAENVQYVDQVAYPAPEPLPWVKEPPKLRYYQEAAVKALLEGKHASVEAGTGTGKSNCLLKLVRDLGLKTVVVAPTISIADQLYELFLEYLGKAKVGRFFNGKKEFAKQIVIGVAQGLAMIKEGTPEYEEFSKVQVLTFDEGHKTAAETLEQVCQKLLANAPYRFFVTATLSRNDGLDLVLNGIVNQPVYKYSVQQGVQDGFLAPLKFKIVCAPRATENNSEDPMTQIRMQLYRNHQLHRKAAEIANNAVNVLGRKVLILIEELDQYYILQKYLQPPHRFAYGGNIAKDKRAKLGITKVNNPNEHVKAFNEGEVNLLVGTSCIAMGTDTKAADFVIYLQGGASDVKVMQAIGRGTRLVPGKTDCIVVDFEILDCKVNKRHLEERKKLYQELGPVTYAALGV